MIAGITNHKWSKCQKLVAGVVFLVFVVSMTAMVASDWIAREFDGEYLFQMQSPFGKETESDTSNDDSNGGDLE